VAISILSLKEDSDPRGAKGLCDKLSRTPGVVDADFDYVMLKLKVTYHPRTIDRSQIKEIMEKYLRSQRRTTR
jgi:hypothetical protein